MQPVFLLNGHDYTEYIEELKPSLNDLDADGSGRNLLDGKMYRKRIATKNKWTVSFLRLDEILMKQLLTDMDSQYVNVTMLDAKANRHVQRTYYTSTINQGVQRYIGGQTVYDGVTFDITER